MEERDGDMEVAEKKLVDFFFLFIIFEKALNLQKIDKIFYKNHHCTFVKNVDFVIK